MHSGGGFAGAALFIGENNAMRCGGHRVKDFQKCVSNCGLQRKDRLAVTIEGAAKVQTINQIDPLRNAIAALRRDGPVALVPTMGALHEGHLSLITEANRHAAHVVVSIFVNPRQFGVNEDLAAYPRQLARDAEMLNAVGVAVLWAPTVEVMYPAAYATNVAVAGLGDVLCGAARPGHFDGVATVVAKLCMQVQPDRAFFGEKDWQQLAIIRRMARDLNLTHPHADNIFGVATIREADGLAMSSRNAYLSAGERAQAAILPQAMRAAIAAMESGAAVQSACADLRQTLLNGGFSAIDYAQLSDADTLQPLMKLADNPARLLVAARIGKARLIDNMPVKRP